jgi:hypothetical protein
LQLRAADLIAARRARWAVPTPAIIAIITTLVEAQPRQSERYSRRQQGGRVDHGRCVQAQIAAHKAAEEAVTAPQGRLSRRQEALSQHRLRWSTFRRELGLAEAEWDKEVVASSLTPPFHAPVDAHCTGSRSTAGRCRRPNAELRETLRQTGQLIQDIKTRAEIARPMLIPPIPWRYE